MVSFSQARGTATLAGTMEVRGTQWQKGSVLVADGAWGTEFFKRGLMQGSPPDEWTLTHPDIVR